MEPIQGHNNELTLIFPHGSVECISSPGEKFATLLQGASISIIGNNNRISLHFDSEEEAEELLLGDGFKLIVKGNDNVVNLGTLIVRHTPLLRMTGFHLIIGQLPGLGPGVSREPNHCRVDIGNHVWVGKDAKIGKNVRISDHSIVGWGSIVTKTFDEPHVILAGIPAKVVKRGINWDRRCINKYLKQASYPAQ